MLGTSGMDLESDRNELRKAADEASLCQDCVRVTYHRCVIAAWQVLRKHQNELQQLEDTREKDLCMLSACPDNADLAFLSRNPRVQHSSTMLSL